VGTAIADDAGVFRLNRNTLIVQTVDVFTPGVDDPYLFGQIAACNSLSDVYAMGGRPVTALSVIGFPIYSLPHKVMTAILKGGIDILRKANTVLLGGHSINDEEVKFGFAVTGVIKRKQLTTNAGARPGDALILTKPLGTGIISLASQVGMASHQSVGAMTKSMITLNRSAAEIMVRFHATACTDITGFGLLGHLYRMVRESGVTAEIRCRSLPLLPEVLTYAAKGAYSGANERNTEFCGPHTALDNAVTKEMRAVLFDAQTSGGLLIAMPGKLANAALSAMHRAGLTAAAVIGTISGRSKGQIRVSA